MPAAKQSRTAKPHRFCFADRALSRPAWSGFKLSGFKGNSCLCIKKVASLYVLSFGNMMLCLGQGTEGAILRMGC